MSTYNMKKKICLLGPPAVGKTSLVRKFVLNMFGDKYITTIGSKVTKKDIVLPETRDGRPVKMTLMIWDISGQDKIANIKAMYLRGADGAIMVCDLTRPETLDSLPDRVDSLFKVAGRVPLVVLANKADLKGRRAVGPRAVGAFASGYDAPYYLTSAKTGENVEKAFEKIAGLMLARGP